MTAPVLMVSAAERQEALTIQRFLDDAAIQAVLDRLEGEAVAAWKTGVNPENREAAFQRWKALDDLRRTLRTIAERAVVATLQE